MLMGHLIEITLLDLLGFVMEALNEMCVLLRIPPLACSKLRRENLLPL
jgi:hypothetical protein